MGGTITVRELYIYIYHTRVLECGLRAFHSLLSNTLERGGGMIFFTKSLVIYCLETLDLMILYLCCCEGNGPLVHTFQFVRMIINLS